MKKIILSIGLASMLFASSNPINNEVSSTSSSVSISQEASLKLSILASEKEITISYDTYKDKSSFPTKNASEIYKLVQDFVDNELPKTTFDANDVRKKMSQKKDLASEFLLVKLNDIISSTGYKVESVEASYFSIKDSEGNDVAEYKVVIIEDDSFIGIAKRKYKELI
jgi:hypothetical protein